MRLYVDPGKFHAALAFFAEDRLKAKTLLKVSGHSAAAASSELGELAFQWLTDLGAVRAGCLECVACEKPAIWTQGGFRGDPNDVLDLMATNGSIMHAVWAHQRAYITTNDWKGQVPKPKKSSEPYIIEQRVRKRLDEQETAVLGQAPDHNVVDAVGIGLWDLKRL
jgi:hypothetical protein